MKAVNPEVRAAEIVAAIRADFQNGGWFECMTAGERRGWDMAADELWFGECTAAPSNAREWAGWLAHEVSEGNWSHV